MEANHAFPIRQTDEPSRGIESGEEHVLGDHVRRGQVVEERRLARIGVADERHHGMRAAPPLAPMQGAGALHRIEVTLDPGDPLLDLAPVGFDLRFARTAEKAEAAALALEMRPGSHQPALLMREMRVLDLQRTFARARTLAEYLEDQGRPVDDLGAERLLQIALLHRRKRAIHDDQVASSAFTFSASSVTLPEPM